MAVTCYAQLGQVGLGQLAPPYFTAEATYVMVDALTNAVVQAQSTGMPTGDVTANVNPPVATQAALLASVAGAIQAAEPLTPGLVFVWLVT